MLLWIAVGPRGLAGHYGEGGGEKNEQNQVGRSCCFLLQIFNSAETLSLSFQEIILLGL